MTSLCIVVLQYEYHVCYKLCSILSMMFMPLLAIVVLAHSCSLLVHAPRATGDINECIFQMTLTWQRVKINLEALAKILYVRN